MKKIILTSIAALCMACPSYATTLTGSGNECNEPILNTDTGPAELRAIWGANTINLEWYSDNTLLDVQQSADTCLYDGAIILPSTNPTKTGYTFGGWQVRQLFNLATLNANTNGTDYYARGWSDDADYCFAYGENTVSDDDGPEVCTADAAALSDVSLHQWKTEFSYGTVRGIARCSTTAGNTSGLWVNGTYHILSGNIQQSITDETGQSGARYCWCQPTGFAEPNSSSYMSVASPSWVFILGNDDAVGCANDCARYCARDVQNGSGFRRAMFGVAGN